MDKKLEQLLKQAYDNLKEGPTLIVPGENGEHKVIHEKQSEFSFIVHDPDNHFKDLLLKLEELGYQIDLEHYKGLFRCGFLIKVDVANKKVGNPMIVGINHLHYLRDDESILVEDVLNNFEEIIVNENHELMESLIQYNKRKN